MINQYPGRGEDSSPFPFVVIDGQRIPAEAQDNRICAAIAFLALGSLGEAADTYCSMKL